MQTLRSVAELVEAAQKNDSQAWDEIVDRFGKLVWSITRSFGLSHDDALDVCQTTWLQLARRLDQISDPDRLGLWLSTTARRECLSYVNRYQSRVRLEPAEDFDARPALRGQPEDTVVELERHRLLWAAINRLPDNCRALLRLFLSEPEPSYAEVACALEMPVNSVGPRRQRCINSLKTMMKGA